MPTPGMYINVGCRWWVLHYGYLQIFIDLGGFLACGFAVISLLSTSYFRTCGQFIRSIYGIDKHATNSRMQGSQ